MIDPSAPALRDEIERFDPAVAIEDASTPPAAWYVSPQLYALERAAVFGRAWQPVTRESSLEGAGAYASGCTVGEPWVVVRDEDQSLRAFSNTCRHKGREVVRGEGRASALVCGYHAWTYDLRGRLRSAPKMAGIRGFDREALVLGSVDQVAARFRELAEQGYTDVITRSMVTDQRQALASIGRLGEVRRAVADA